MSNIKDCFKSRYKDGYLIEVDYSQLEVIVLAFLSGDKQLRDDILSGKDLHTMRASELFSIPESAVTSPQRRIAKTFSFQLQYGSGAKNMAEQNNTSVVLAKQFITNYYNRYGGVKEYQNMIAEEVSKSRRITKKRTKNGLPLGKGTYKSLTGRTYTFLEYDSPEFMQQKGVMVSFSPTQMKNYPVQGLATGDIVQMMLGEVYFKLQEDSYLKDNSKMINTIHDSMLFDCRGIAVPNLCNTLKELLEDTPKYFLKYFGYTFDLPLNIDIKLGKTWGNLEKV